MLNTYVRDDAARRFRQGLPWVYREEILRTDGTPAPGETVMVRDEAGRSLGLGDLDLDARLAIRRIGRADETVEGLLQRHLRLALERRSLLVQDPRYCRLVHEDGDALPGLVVDRYDTHFVVQTSTRAMDGRVEDIARSLVNVLGARSVLLRNDNPRRKEAGLPPSRPHVLFGTPPRWTRVLEMGARFTVDLFSGEGTGYFYDQRQVRRAIVRMSHGKRVLNPCCYVGGHFVHAGLHGARSILAFDVDPDAADLARENAEANGLISRATVETADAFTALEALHEPFDLVLLHSPDLAEGPDLDQDPFVRLIRLCVRNTRHGGRMILSANLQSSPAHSFDARVAYACESEGRLATRLFRPSLPVDFPTVLGSPGAEYMGAVAIELS
ncbi:MAG: class I SAM-dependent methyltransferase [Myxococcota bacterium]|nr:class I SAM-dependent methyltransferase [Myxococcota bacterium]